MSIFNNYFNKPTSYVRNNAGGIVVEPDKKEKLVNLALLSTFNNGPGASKDQQVVNLLNAAKACEPLFVAKVILYAKETGKMRDTTSFLLSYLSTVDINLFKRVFKRVVSSGRDLRNFVQAVRSNLTGRKSLGTALKREINAVIDGMDRWGLLSASIGNNPSFADVINLSHYKPNESNASLIRWILGGDVVPPEIYSLNNYTGYGVPPVLPFEFYQNKIKDWTWVIPQLSYKQLIINLNNIFKGFCDPQVEDLVCARITDINQIKKSGWFPFRFYSAMNNVNTTKVKEALRLATQYALENVPVIDGEFIVAPDVSGSMASPVTGYREGASTVIRCADVAALFSSALMFRKGNRGALVPFDTEVRPVNLTSFWDSVASIAKAGGGGTDCSAPLRIGKNSRKPPYVIIISDNESWRQKYAIDKYWAEYKRDVPNAKLVCWDLAPNGKHLVSTSPDVLNVGGFSGEEFTLIGKFLNGEDINVVKQVEAVNV